MLGGAADVFSSYMGKFFDIVSAYEAAAELIIGAILTASRLERLLLQQTPFNLVNLLTGLSRYVYADLPSRYLGENKGETSLRQNAGRKRNYIFEMMAIQNVLLNKLLELLQTDSGTKLSVPTRALILKQVHSIHTILSASVISNTSCVMSEIDVCDDVIFTWNSHIDMLQDKIYVGKPFMKILIPDGPPI